MNVFYPRILDGSLNVLRRIEPVRGSLDMELEPLSSAELELQPGDSIPERSWVAVFTAYGLAGIFRSKPQRDRYGERSTTVSLVHGATELNDYLTGKTDEDVQSAANTAIQTIFSSYHGSLWTLGTVSPTASVVYGLNNSGVLDAIVDLMEQLPGYMVTFDQTVTPWTVNVIPRPSEVTAEGRLSRNIQSVEITRDDSSLCTKVYYGENNSYVQDTTAIQKYGVIEHRISDSGYTDVQLAAMAQAYLDSHKAPKLSVSISAIDLSQITGEPLDQIALGSKYRLVIPDAETEENRVIEQIVCSVRYDDFLTNPNPQITLASDPESIITFLKQQRRSGGAGRAVKQLEEKVNNQYQHWTTENDVYKESVYKILGVTYDNHGKVIYIQKTDAQGNPVWELNPDGSYKLDENGEKIPVYETDAAGNPIPVYDETSNGSITGKVVQTAQNYNSLYQMTLNAPEFDPTATYAIGSMVMHNGTVYKFTAAHTGDWTGTDVTVVPPLQSQITQNATEISQKVSQGALSGYLTITAAQTKLGNVIEWSDGSIKAAEVVTAINEQTGQTQVQISADQIDLHGYVTASELYATDAEIGQYLKADNIIVTGKIRTAEFQATNGAQIESGLEVSDGAVIGGGLIADSISVGTKSSNTPLGDAIKEITLTGPDASDMYTLTATTLSNQTITIGNFSRAASQGGTTLNGVWGGSTYTVTDSAYGETWTINFDPQTTSDDTWATEIGSGTVNSRNNKWLDFPLYIGKYNQSGPMTRSVTINRSIDASAIFAEGQKDVTPTINPAGWRWHEVSGDTVLDNTVTARNPYNASNNQSTTVTLPALSVSVTNNQVIVNASDGTVSGVVATASHTKYADGQASVVPTFAAFTGTPGSTAQELSPGTYEFKVTKDGSITTDEFYTVPTAPTPPDPKISRDGTWSSGSQKFIAGTTGSDDITVKIKSDTQSGTLVYGDQQEPTKPTAITFDVYEDTGNNTKADTGADITATIARNSATLSLGTFDSTNSKFTVSKSSGGTVSVGGSSIQVGITPLDILVTKGTATPNTPQWDSTNHKYAITADGSFQVGVTGNLTTIAQTQGSIEGGFIPTDSINYGKSLSRGISNITLQQTTETAYNNAINIPELGEIKGNGYYYVTAIPVDGTSVVKKFHAPSGGSGSSDRTATYLEKITLTAPQNPEQDFNWTFDVGSIAHYENPTSVGTVNTNVQIDASAIYQAGVSAGTGATVDVVKGNWELSIRPPNIGNLCTFSPSIGTGETASVLLRSVPQTKSKDNATATANVSITDYGQGIFSVVSYLVKGTNDYAGYVYLTTNQGSVTDSNILAKIPIDGVPGADSRYISTLSPIKLTPSDISTSTKETTATFDIGDNQTNVPISIDASDVYTKGLTDGSRLNIEELRTITQPLTVNTDYTFKPSDYKDVMRAIKFKVDVPIGIDSASILRVNDNSGTYSGWDGKAEELSHKYCQIEVVPNSGENYYLKIDASKLYDKGVAYGASSAGYQLTTVELAGTPNKFKSINVPTGTDTVRAVSGNGAIYQVNSNGTVYLRGAGVSKAGEGKIFSRNNNGAYVYLGEGKCFITDDNVTTLYKSSTLRLSPVNATNYTVATGSRSAYVTDSNGSIVFYTKGRTVSDTYYIKTS